MVTAALYDVVLAVGMEKLYDRDKSKSLPAFSGAVDVEAMAEIMAGLSPCNCARPVKVAG
jgi:hypothetical protein